MQVTLFRVCALSLLVLLELPVVAETHDASSYCAGAHDHPCDSNSGEVYKEPWTTEVSYNQLKAMLSSSSIQLFDVRNPDEFQDGHIAGSTNIPLGALQEALRLTPDQFKQKFGIRAPQKKDTDIVLYCQRGLRSNTALGIMQALGFSKARHFAGGYIDWVQREDH